MWKRAFIVLLSFNLLLVVGFTAWWGTLPRAGSTGLPVTPGAAGSTQLATVKVAIGDQAINSYLQYALSEQQDVKKVLSYAKVGFGNQWDVQLGIKLTDRVVPFNLNFQPQIQGGNLWLQVQSASMGQIPIPVAALIFVFRHLPWPTWIAVNANTSTLELNFTQRPQNPYGVAVESYSSTEKLLTLNISIQPKTLMKSKP